MEGKGERKKDCQGKEQNKSMKMRSLSLVLAKK